MSLQEICSRQAGELRGEFMTKSSLKDKTRAHDRLWLVEAADALESALRAP